MDSDNATAEDKPVQTEAEKLFTAAQANEALVLVRKIVADIVDAYARLLAARARRQELSNMVGVEPELRRLQNRIDALVEQLSELHEELTAVGCVLKDWSSGLVDFPAVVDGRRIWLCWKLGEDQVSYWHELDAGFAGRKCLDAGVGRALMNRPA